MQDDESAASDCHAAASGLLQCLVMLADEADKRRLARTHVALRKAIRACRDEAEPDSPSRRSRSPRSRLLH